MSLVQRHQPTGRASAVFADDEPVFQGRPLVNDSVVPRFGWTSEWSGAALPKAVNVPDSMNRLRFFDDDPIWNLRIREVVMAELNPTHRSLRDLRLLKRSHLPNLRTMRHRTGALSRLAKYAIAEGLPHDLAEWTQPDLDAYLGTLDRPSSAVASAAFAIKRLHHLHPLLTDGGLTFEPWRGKAARSIGQLPPTSGPIATPAIPPDVFWPLVRGAWAYIDTFSTDILEARRRRLAAPGQLPSGHLVHEEVTVVVERFVADPESVVPLHSGVGKAGGGRSGINWSALNEQLFDGAGVFVTHRSAWKAPLHEAVEQMAAEGRCQVGAFGMRPVAVTRADGTSGPWHDDFDKATAIHEELLLRQACFVYGLALTAMRDSEWQELRRGALIEHFGSPAIRGPHIKGRAQGSEGAWWIIEPVARAISIAEQLSWHDEHVWVSGMRDDGERSRPGLDPYRTIDGFIEGVNRTADRTGLTPIPQSRVRPHMFRRTFSIIAAREPMGELGLQHHLKHAARRAIANAQTGGYYAEDPSWADDFDDEQTNAAVDELLDLAIRRRAGEAVAVGPGSSRFHDRLDDALAASASENQTARAHVGDERFLRTLLASEFTDLHLGNLNHCMFEEATAECRKTASGPAGPLIDMCRPGRCSNSIVSGEHLPIWRAERDDLAQLLTIRRLAPGRRALLQARLAEVDDVMSQATDGS